MSIDEVATIVEKVFNLKKGSVNAETTSADIEEWDSLGQFSLIDYLDQNFKNITKKNTDFLTASSVKELYDSGLKDL
jgi:acyl carrier protein